MLQAAQHVPDRHVEVLSLHPTLGLFHLDLSRESLPQEGQLYCYVTT